MQNLNFYLNKAQKGKYAIGHFNISNLEGLLSIIKAAKKLNAPVMIGTSEGEANFIGYKQAIALVKVYQEETELPIFLNADHHKNYQSAKIAIDAGYQSIHIDASYLNYEDNIKETKRVADYAREISKNISVEGELGFVKGLSEVSHKKINLNKEDYTDKTKVADFIKRTGVDRLAVCIGNIHGLNEEEPDLDLNLLAELKKEAGDTFLVLHAASGIAEEQIVKAISIGVVNVHVNTELRIAYMSALRQVLQEKKEETTPYKLFPEVIASMQKVVEEKIQIFGSING